MRASGLLASRCACSFVKALIIDERATKVSVVVYQMLQWHSHRFAHSENRYSFDFLDSCKILLSQLQSDPAMPISLAINLGLHILAFPTL